ncbi:MAG: c-type cytochrome [Thermoleophilaceae bacterium]
MTGPITRRRARMALCACAATAVFAVAGCSGEIDVAAQHEDGATLFYERCSGCHTFKRANSYGSKPEGQLQGGERTNGPSFDVRPVSKEDALYAIRNGGFSGGIMPAHIVVGDDAEAVADFIAEYSGEDAGE